VRIGGVGAGPRAAHLLDHGAAGYVWRAPGWGTYRVSPDGRRAWCAPAHVPTWRWQRMLVGQVLPLAALLHGLEVVHAGAVGIDGGAIVLAGDSGAGKSTLVAALLRRGAGFLTDDVVALEPAADGLLAHPGMASMSLRRPAAAENAGVGDLVGEDADEVRMVVPRVDGPLPVRAVLFVVRGSYAGVAAHALPASDFRPFLAMTFNRALVTPARLEQQFEVAARLALLPSLWRLEIPLAADPAEVAARILDLRR
jgi:hypothetical protein